MTEEKTQKVSVWKNGLMMTVVSRKEAEEMISSGIWEEPTNGYMRTKDRKFW